MGEADFSIEMSIVLTGPRDWLRMDVAVAASLYWRKFSVDVRYLRYYQIFADVLHGEMKILGFLIKKHK